MTGKIVWTDLTVKDAEEVKQFYQQVVGWQPESVNMGDYSDFNMLPPDEKEPAAGICHAKGGNSDIPPVWMVYIQVDDLQHSLKQCEDQGGKVLKKAPDGQKFAIIEDPAGAVCALYQAN